jgi:GH15 family glucan-1,4-alpha-glucosidase
VSDAVGRRPIGDYGLIGDTRTAALVSSAGAIDWLCAPHFDGDAVFARLVGGPAAGTFRTGPARPTGVVRRCYRHHTATLETVWDAVGGQLTLAEGMVAEVAGRLLPATLLVRRLTARDGPVDVTIEFDPRFGDDRHAPRAVRRGDVLVCTDGSLALALEAIPDVRVDAGGSASVRVEPGRPLTLALSIAHREPLVHVDPSAAWAALEADGRRWRAWAGDVDEDVPSRDAVVRSLLTLRLLTYSPSGAPVAAPTTSLPEEIGGVRNWDYRFTWPRDASIGVGTFLGAGKDREAAMFFAWLLHASRLDRPRLPVLLTLHGKHGPPERTLEGWPGYAGSAPVRAGNGAGDQHQLDGYGWVLDAAWLRVRAGGPLGSEAWRAMQGFADRVCDRWREPDAGIWEVRGAPQQFVHSKLMAWLALDRALRIADTHRLPRRRHRRWRAERDAIAQEVRERGFDEARGSYTRSYGSGDLDAAVLVLPLLGLDDPHGPRVRHTIDAIREDLDAGFPLLYRYRPGDDGLPGREGAFLPCAFWLVQALAAVGRVDEATERFDALAGLASPLGLYGEEMDPASREHLGNFPQALSHATLVQAALALRDAGVRDARPTTAGGRDDGTSGA